MIGGGVGVGIEASPPLIEEIDKVEEVTIIFHRTEALEEMEENMIMMTIEDGLVDGDRHLDHVMIESEGQVAEAIAAAAAVVVLVAIVVEAGVQEEEEEEARNKI